jgi:diguanylate cyclase (GGDEF)-like protein/PAS domain S-box-containing protein
MHEHRREAGELSADAFRIIADRTAAPFVMIEPDGHIVWASRSIEGTTGWTAEAIVGRNMIEFLPDDQVPRALEAIAEITTVDREGLGVPIVFAVVGPHGDRTWVEVGATPLFDEGLALIVLRHRPFAKEHHFDAFLGQLVGAADLSAVIEPLTRSIAASVEGAGAVVHHGYDGTCFVGAVGSGLPEPWLERCGTSMPWALAASSGEPFVADVTGLPERLATSGAEAGLRACWSLPVPGTDGIPPSALTIVRSRPGPPLVGHRMTFERNVRLVQLALQRNAEHQRLSHLARHDSLTGVANRADFRDRLVAALSVGEPGLAVAYCDLDGFKPVNDTLGHGAGDLVLVEVAQRLRAALRGGDALARAGGDEFTVLLRNVPDADTAVTVCRRLGQALTEPIEVDDTKVDVGISVGVALAAASDKADTLLRRADQALYEAKRAGGGVVRVAP